MNSVLVTDGGQRSALAVVRSLGAAGYDVHVCATRIPSLAGASRFASSDHLVPDPLVDPEGFARMVASRADATSSVLVLPVTDASVTAVLERREHFAAFRLPFPSLESYRAISDKGGVASVADTLDIRVPRQSVLPVRHAPVPTELETLGFPVVVKPSRSVVAEGGRLHKTSVTYAGSREELDHRLAGLPDGAFPVLLQERVEGWGIGVFLLIWDGELLASFAHRRLREKPPSGGVSVLRESAPVPADLLARSRALLERFDWQGIAMVEYKGASTDSEPVLMEVNGRFWGSLQLAVDAGVDFPRLLAAAALGEPLAPVTEYRPGVRCRWFWGDVDHLIARMRRSPRELALPAGSPGRLRAGWEFAKAFGPGTRGEVLHWDDPLPAVRETMDWFRRR